MPCFPELSTPEYVLGLGLEDVADFAYAYSDTSDLSTLLDDVPAEIWTALEVADYAHSIPAARIRKAFEIAKAVGRSLRELDACFLAD